MGGELLMRGPTTLQRLRKLRDRLRGVPMPGAVDECNQIIDRMTAPVDQEVATDGTYELLEFSLVKTPRANWSVDVPAFRIFNPALPPMEQCIGEIFHIPEAGRPDADNFRACHEQTGNVLTSHGLPVSHVPYRRCVAAVIANHIGTSEWRPDMS